MESQPQNPELKRYPENFHPRIYVSIEWIMKRKKSLAFA